MQHGTPMRRDLYMLIYREEPGTIEACCGMCRTQVGNLGFRGRGCASNPPMPRHGVSVALTLERCLLSSEMRDVCPMIMDVHSMEQTMYGVKTAQHISQCVGTALHRQGACMLIKRADGSLIVVSLSQPNGDDESARQQQQLETSYKAYMGDSAIVEYDQLVHGCSEVPLIMESPSAVYGQTAVQCFCACCQAHGHAIMATLGVTSNVGIFSMDKDRIVQTSLCRVPSGRIFVPACMSVLHSMVDATTAAGVTPPSHIELMQLLHQHIQSVIYRIVSGLYHSHKHDTTLFVRKCQSCAGGHTCVLNDSHTRDQGWRYCDWRRDECTGCEDEWEDDSRSGSPRPNGYMCEGVLSSSSSQRQRELDYFVMLCRERQLGCCTL